MAIYEASVQPMALRESTLRGIPGALAFFGAIGFAVGVVDEAMREQLWGVIAGSGLVALVFGAWAFVIHKRGNRPIAVNRQAEVCVVHLAGQTLRAPEVERGVFHMRGIKRSYWVAWVRLDDGERSAVIRKGLGIADPKPSWPESGYRPASLGDFYGEPAALASALGAGRLKARSLT